METFVKHFYSLKCVLTSTCGLMRFALNFLRDSTICFDWESALQQVARDILTEKSPAGLLAMRGRLYELLGHGLAPSLIIKVTLVLDYVTNPRKLESCPSVIALNRVAHGFTRSDTCCILICTLSSDGSRLTWF